MTPSIAPGTAVALNAKYTEMPTRSVDKRYSTTRRVILPGSDIPEKPNAGTLVASPQPVRHSNRGGLRTIGYGKADSVELCAGNTPVLPLISIITVTFNAGALLEQTILSVLDQTYDNVEYIVVDGNSTDGTLDVIRKYEHAIDYWISEPDSGIYEAMNKGIALASGYYIALLNAADWYSAELLGTIAQEHIASSADARSILYTNFHLYIDDLGYAEKRKCTVAPWKGMSISHQAMFIGAAAYKAIGFYDLRYRLAADYDFFLRAHATGCRFVHVDNYGVFFRSGGRSAIDKAASIREAAKALRNVYGCFSVHHARYVVVEFLGLVYFRYFKNILVRIAGEKNITAIRKIRRRIR
jgi:glycosyltransferase involved in cell wall biosynthesis